MKTLGKSFTNKIFINQEAYDKFRKDWATRIQNKEEIESHWHTFFLILAGKDWRKGYSEYSDFYTVKNDLERIKYVLKYSPDCFNIGKAKKYFGNDLKEGYEQLLLRIFPELNEITEEAIRNKTLPEYRTLMSGVS